MEEPTSICENRFKSSWYFRYIYLFLGHKRQGNYDEGHLAELAKIKTEKDQRDYDAGLCPIQTKFDNLRNLYITSLICQLFMCI